MSDLPPWRPHCWTINGHVEKLLVITLVCVKCGEQIVGINSFYAFKETHLLVTPSACYGEEDSFPWLNCTWPCSRMALSSAAVDAETKSCHNVSTFCYQNLSNGFSTRWRSRVRRNQTVWQLSRKKSLKNQIIFSKCYRVSQKNCDKDIWGHFQLKTTITHFVACDILRFSLSLKMKSQFRKHDLKTQTKSKTSL